MRLHTKLSLLKSVLRIIGYVFVTFNLIIGIGLLILAEVIGMVEEIDDK